MDLLDDDALLDLRKRGRGTDPAEVMRELQQAADADEEGVDWGALRPEPASEGGEAVPAGTCPICKVRPGRLSCRSCARLVCKADAWIMFGLCRTCAKEDRVRNWHDGARPEGRNWLEE